MEKCTEEAPNGPGGFVPTNPDLEDMSREFDVDSDIFSMLLDSTFLDFQVRRFPKSGLGRAWALGRLGPWTKDKRTDIDDLARWNGSFWFCRNDIHFHVAKPLVLVSIN